MIQKMRSMVVLLIVSAIFVATPSLASAAFGDRTMQKGSSGEDVKELQDYLMTKGMFPYHTATGYYGPITENAVAAFQESRNLQVDGLAGSETNNKVQVLRRGDIGKQVIHIQSQLQEAGYENQVDGIYGSGMVATVEQFQRNKGLTADGIAGPATRKALNQIASPGSSAAGKEITVESTAYTASCTGCSGVTKMGIDLEKYPDAKVIAVDPNQIPLGSIVEVEGYGTAIAADIGGDIDHNRIDIFIPGQQDALNWGRKDVTVRIIE
ncbi:peptidoglycan-binding protein [Bacillus sp. RAR_GA_16]|uniref:peptidoglycan-binding protein n=1 Tax=Bacillus sp. RAR_GA_16 TaxID=2876774 RepID=UPI00398C39E7